MIAPTQVVLPAAEASEAEVLGYLMGSPLDARELADKLHPELFYVGDHRRIFEAVRALLERGEDVDPTLVVGELGRRGTIDAVRDRALGVERLYADRGIASTVRTHVERIIEAHERRRVLGVANDIANAAIAGTDWRVSLHRLEELGEPEVPIVRDRWPILRPEALYGLTGEVVGSIAPTTEADRVALLLTFLVLAGNEVGPDTYVQIGQVRHPPRLFAVLVGESAVARKGTSFADVRSLFYVEDDLNEYRVLKGFGSGEGLIMALAERIGSLRKDDDPDTPPRDPRMVVVESEFTSVLRVAARDGSTLSHVLRDAWDGTTLQNNTKMARIRVPGGSMVSLIGHVTADELRAELTRTDAASGFGNRFLLASVRRARSLPLPVSLDLHGLGTDVRGAAMAGSRSGALRWQDDAIALWTEVYAAHLADVDSLGGIAAPMVARGDAQMVRLIAAYAALDGAGMIRPEHVEAARAVWDYCRASTLRVFGDATGDPIADRIAEAVEDAQEGLSRSELHDLFGRHCTARRVEVAVATVIRSGRFEEIDVPTAGRPRTVLIPLRTNEGSEGRGA